MASGSTTETVYQFKISLKGIRPSIWRRIQVPKDYSLYALHVAIQDSMGWKDCHLHEFSKFSRKPRVNYVVGFENDSDFSSVTVSGKISYIKDYFEAPKDTANYLYDFGDDWEHTIKLEKILAAVPGEEYPKCVGGARACPPEDVGGVYGYKEHLKIISDSNHKEYEEHMEWLNKCNVGGSLNPEKFDFNSVKFEDVEERWKLAQGPPADFEPGDIIFPYDALTGCAPQ